MNNEIKKLKKTISELRRDLNTCNEERFKYRNSSRMAIHWIDDKFSWFVDLLAEGKSPNLAWLIKNMKDELERMKK
jgi:hypothetical protein